MEKVMGLFGGGGDKQLKEIRAAQQRQEAELAKQRAGTEAKESALRRLFSGGAGVSLASGSPLATSLGG